MTVLAHVQIVTYALITLAAGEIRLLLSDDGVAYLPYLRYLLCKCGLVTSAATSSYSRKDPTFDRIYIHKLSQIQLFFLTN
jgi:hypothetical protein